MTFDFERRSVPPPVIAQWIYDNPAGRHSQQNTALPYHAARKNVHCQYRAVSDTIRRFFQSVFSGPFRGDRHRN